MKTGLNGKPWRSERLRQRGGSIRTFLLLLFQGCAHGLVSFGGPVSEVEVVYHDNNPTIKGGTQLHCVTTLFDRLHNHTGTCRTKTHYLGGDLMDKGGAQPRCVATLFGRERTCRTDSYRYYENELTIKGGIQLHCAASLFGETAQPG